MSGASITGAANRRQGANREQGAYLVLYALLGVAFATMAAIVLDIAALRQGRRVDRTTADLAASAGVAELHDNIPTAAQSACQTAWGYVLANRNGEAGSITPPPCPTVFPSASACNSGTTARTANATLGPLTVEITHPVPDGSPLMLAEAQGGDIPQAVGAADGSQCSRLAVRIVRTRTFLFGQLAGVGGASTDIHSVARAFTGTSTTELPSVIALEPTGCDALVTDAGGGALRVGTVTRAGLAIVDSDGSTCSSGQYIISPGAAGGGANRIQARAAGPVPGRIASYALGRAGSAQAFDPAAVTTGRLNPSPTPVIARTGRRIIDDRYRCPSCGPGGDPIGQLQIDRKDGPPAGATTYTGPCTVNGAAVVLSGANHLYVNCPDFIVDTKVTFLGQSLTFNGNVQFDPNSCFTINDTACGEPGIVSQDADMFVRGNVTKAVKGQAVLPRTFVYATGFLQSGVDEDTSVGNSTLNWSAPTAGPYEDLLFWSESPGQMVLGEQKNVSLVGTFFAPNAPIAINPRNGGGVTALMQLVAKTVRVSGNGVYRLEPTPDRATGSITPQVRLLR